MNILIFYPALIMGAEFVWPELCMAYPGSDVINMSPLLILTL